MTKKFLHVPSSLFVVLHLKRVVAVLNGERPESVEGVVRVE